MFSNIGPAIRHFRKLRKLTLATVAAAVGTDTGNLSRIERNIQHTSDEQFEKIAAALGVEPRELFLYRPPGLPTLDQLSEAFGLDLEYTSREAEEVVLSLYLGQLQKVVDDLAPILKDVGRAALVKWAQGQSSQAETIATLEALTKASKVMPKAPAVSETPVTQTQRDEN